MKQFLTFHGNYLKTAKRFGIDPLLLFTAASLSHSSTGFLALYLSLIVIVHFPIIFYKS